jgi:hypothetical protein
MNNQKKGFYVAEQPNKSMGEAIKAVCFMTNLFIIFSLFASHANSQNLFGNPSCINWKTTSKMEKTTWLNAFLAPLNLTNISRKKLPEDKFSKLPSLDPAVHYVDHFCELNANEFASVGAIQFLEKLTNGS